MHHWIKLRVGLKDHLPRMSDAECKLFDFLALSAPIRGKRTGMVDTTCQLIAEGCGWSKAKAARVLADLESHGYIDVQRSTNHKETSTVIIRKFIQGDDADKAPEAAQTAREDAGAPSHPQDGTVSPARRQNLTSETVPSHPQDGTVSPVGRSPLQAVENKTTSGFLRVREREEREEYSPLPPSRPHWSDEDFPELPDDALEYLMDVYPIGRHSPTTARAAFQAECVDNPNFAKIYPKLRAAVEYAAHRCPPAKRQFLPGLARVIAGDWEGLQARTDHYAAEVATGANGRPPRPTLDELRRLTEDIPR